MSLVLQRKLHSYFCGKIHTTIIQIFNFLARNKFPREFGNLVNVYKIIWISFEYPLKIEYPFIHLCVYNISNLNILETNVVLQFNDKYGRQFKINLLFWTDNVRDVTMTYYLSCLQLLNEIYMSTMGHTSTIRLMPW